MRRLVPAALLVCLAGCKSEPSGKSGGVVVSATPSGSTAPVESPERRLALEPTRGSSMVDKEIDRHQTLARKLPKVEVWVTLGRAWITKAREASDPGFYANAAACADLALAIEPESGLALGLKAQTALNDHRFNDAHELAQRVLLRSPEDLTALGVDSDAMLELGKFKESTAAAQRLLDLKPSLAAYARVSYLRWLVGDFEGAKEAARLAATSGRSARDPEPLAWALVQAALLFHHKGDYEGALAGYDKALEAMADYPPAMVGRGRSKLAMGKPKEALAPLRRAIEKSWSVEGAWLLADAEALAGEAEAEAKTRAEIERRGRLADPRTLSLYWSARGERGEDALALAEQEKKKRGDIYTEDALGFALYRAGKLDAAREALERANALGTKDAALWFHLGLVKLAQGDKKGGEKLLRDALALSPAFDVRGAAEAKRALGSTK